MEGENSNVADASEFCHFEVVAEDAFCAREHTHSQYFYHPFTIQIKKMKT